MPKPPLVRAPSRRMITAAAGAVVFTAAVLILTLRVGPPLFVVLDVVLPLTIALLWSARGRDFVARGGPLAPAGSLMIFAGVAIDLVPGLVESEAWSSASTFVKVGGVALLAIVADRCRRSRSDGEPSGPAQLSALDLLAEPLLGIDADGRVVYQSRAARPLVGRDVARARMPLAEILSLEGIDVDAALGSHAKAPGGFCCHGRVLGERSRDVIVTVHDADGFQSAGGAPLAAVVQLVDVPSTLLGRRNGGETPTSFVRQLARIAHELNNPLAALCGASALLERGGGQKDARTNDPLVEGIVRHAERCRRIVRRVLGLVRGEREGEGEVELNRLVEQFSEDFHSVFSNRGVMLKVQPAELPTVVWSNRAGLEEVLINLVSNACSAMIDEAAGRGGGSVQISVKQDGDTAGFDVEDDGPGIPDEVRERVFDEFVSGRPGGTGLGLTICREVVDASGGTIVAEPRQPNGTRIRVRLPCSQPAPRTDTSDSRTQRVAKRRLRVLAADDEPVLRLVIERSLSAAGHSVVAVEDGAAAKDRLLREEFDVVVSDRAMPKLDGDSLYQETTRERPEYRGRFVFLSGSAFESLPDDVRQDGCVLVAKPFEEVDLLRAVDSIGSQEREPARG